MNGKNSHTHLSSGIVRVLDPDGSTAGAGFVVSPEGIIVTCSHVILDEESQSKKKTPPGNVTVRFLADDSEMQADVVRDQWRYISEGDIAFLRIRGSLPDMVKPFSLSDSEKCVGKSFETLGFPITSIDELYAEGKIEYRSTGNTLQVNSNNIAQGFSGAPLFLKETKQVVGMISSITPSDEDNRDQNVAFVIPVEKLCEVNRSLPLDPLKGARGELINVPELPQNYQERVNQKNHNHYLTDLKKIIFSGGDQAVGIVGVNGMGGIGKTVLAAALARNEEVRKQFSDGAIWYTVGQGVTDDKILKLQAFVVRHLTGRRVPFTDTQDGRSEIEPLLKKKSCLIILDDLWNSDNWGILSIIESLGSPGNKSRLIFTTRYQGQVLGTELFPVDKLNHDESRKLLAAWAGCKENDLPPEADVIVRKCGSLPLAISISGAIIKRGSRSWESLVKAFEEAKLQVLTLPSARALVNDLRFDILVSVQASYNALPEDIRQRFLELAVFPEDEQIPESAVSTLWAYKGCIDDDEYWSDMITVLQENSLLYVKGDTPNRSIEFHDIIHDFLRYKTGNLATAHHDLIQAYDMKNGGDWHSGPDDGYFFQHITSHFFEAGKMDELRTLLLDPKCMHAKLEATDVGSLITDYTLIKNDKDLHLIHGALCLSSHILSQDKSQLAAHLFGRLLGFESPDIKKLLEETRILKTSTSAFPWLCPLRPSMDAPGGLLLMTLKGHTSFVTAVIMTADGKVVSGSEDGTLKVWDLDTGQCMKTLEGHTDSVRAVAMSADERAVSCSSDKTLKVWDLDTGQCLKTLAGHGNTVTAVALAADDKVVSCSSDKTLKVWDLDTGQCLKTLVGHSKPVYTVAIMVAGRVVSGSDDNTLKIWNHDTGKCLKTLKGHADRVISITITTDGRVVSGSEDGSLKVWDLDTGKCLKTWKLYRNGLEIVTLTTDRRAVSSSGNDTLKVWDLDTGKCLKTLKGHHISVTAVATIANGRAVSGSLDRTLKVWDLDTGKCLKTLEGHTKAITAVAITADGRAVSGSLDGTLKVWNLDTSESLKTLKGLIDWENAVILIVDGREVSSSGDRLLKLSDLNTGKSLKTLKGHIKWMTSVVLTTDGRMIYNLGKNFLRVCDLNTGISLKTLEGHTSFVTAVIMAADGKVVSGSEDGTLKVWNLDTGQCLKTLEGHHNSVTAITITAAGRVVSGSEDDTLKVWDLDTGRCLKTLEGHTDAVYAVAITTDGRVVSGSYDTTLKVWDLDTGQCLKTLEGHTDSVRAVAMVTDRRAVSASKDSTIILWDLVTGEMLARFQGEAAFPCICVTPDDKIIIAGDEVGNVHVLQVEG